MRITFAVRKGNLIKAIFEKSVTTLKNILNIIHIKETKFNMKDNIYLMYISMVSDATDSKIQNDSSQLFVKKKKKNKNTTQYQFVS